MNIKTILMTLSMAFIFYACDDMLEDKIYDRLTPNNYFSNDAEAIAAVMVYMVPLMEVDGIIMGQATKESKPPNLVLTLWRAPGAVAILMILVI